MNFMNLKSIKSVILRNTIWILDFLWNGYGFMILKNMDFGMDMDLVLNAFGPTDY